MTLRELCQARNRVAVYLAQLDPLCEEFVIHYKTWCTYDRVIHETLSAAEEKQES